MENCHTGVRCKFIIYCLILIILSSCNRKHDFGYNEDKSEYMANVNCFRQNYSKIYTPLNHTPSIYYSPVSVTKHAVCSELFTVMQKHGIAYVNFERDSSVAFYSLPQGINNKQFILIFITDRIKIHDKIKKGIKLIDKIDSNCYELEKVN
jgi:hypothetical protein